MVEGVSPLLWGKAGATVCSSEKGQFRPGAYQVCEKMTMILFESYCVVVAWR